MFLINTKGKRTSYKRTYRMIHCDLNAYISMCLCVHIYMTVENKLYGKRYHKQDLYL